MMEGGGWGWGREGRETYGDEDSIEFLLLRDDKPIDQLALLLRRRLRRRRFGDHL